MRAAGLVKSTLLITGITGIGLVLGFLSSVVTASRFGAGGEMDVYFAATTLPLFLTTIAAGLISSAFIPSFLEYEAEGRPDLWRFVSTMLNGCALVALALCVLGMVFAREIMAPLAPGFGPEKLDRAASLFRLMIPSVFLATVMEMLAAVYYSRRRFLLPSLAKAAPPILTILFVLSLSGPLGTTALALAMLATGLGQAALLIGGLRSVEGFRYHFTLGPRTPAVDRVLKLALPLALSMPIYRSMPVFDRWVGSTLPEGNISVLGYASRLLGVIQPILISGIATALFPYIAEQAARKDMAGLAASLGKSGRMLLLAGVPIAAFLALFGEPLIHLLYQRGSFSAEAADMTHRALAFYLFSLPCSLLGTVIGQGFLAVRDTRTTSVVGLIETAFYMILCWTLLPSLGLYAVPVAFSAYLFLSLMACIHLLSRKIGTNLFAGFAPMVIRQAAAVIAAAGLATALGRALPSGLPFDLAPLAAAFVAYAFMMRYVLSSPEALYLQDMAVSKARALLGGLAPGLAGKRR